MSDQESEAESERSHSDKDDSDASSEEDSDAEPATTCDAAPEADVVAPSAAEQPVECEAAALVRRTPNILSKYERARLLGVRAQRISCGARAAVEVGHETDALRIAQLELARGAIRATVRRHTSKHGYEDFSCEELTAAPRALKFAKIE